MLQGKLDVESCISTEDLDRLMKERVYAGYSLSPTVEESIKQALFDEYKLSASQLKQFLEEADWQRQVTESYKRHMT